MKPILQMTDYTVGNPSLPEVFDGFRIAQISDFHNAELGDGNMGLIQALIDESPDIIAITGDFLDARKPDIERCESLLRSLANIAPCYFVPGNHEAKLNALYKDLEDKMDVIGIHVLRDTMEEIDRSGFALYIIGVEDPCFEDTRHDMVAKVLHRKLSKIMMPNAYTILLTHRPEPLWLYQRHNVGLALAGHAHGGQIRLPVLGAIYSPNQGLFPRYTSGLYEKGRTQMVVSRGIGGSRKVPRINNHREIPIITLHCDEHYQPGDPEVFDT